MAKISLAARNYCIQLPPIAARIADGSLGSSTTWPEGWVFDSHIPIILDNASHTSAIVFTEGNWQEPNPHNTAQFPLVNLDIWAAPTRDAQNSITVYDADDLIQDIFDELRPYFHTVNKDVPGITGDPDISYLGSPGEIRFWGTADQIQNRTGIPVLGSQHITSSEFRDVAGGNGVRVRSHMFGLETF